MFALFVCSFLFFVLFLSFWRGRKIDAFLRSNFFFPCCIKKDTIFSSHFQRRLFQLQTRRSCYKMYSLVSIGISSPSLALSIWLSDSSFFSSDIFRQWMRNPLSLNPKLRFLFSLKPKPSSLSNDNPIDSNCAPPIYYMRHAIHAIHWIMILLCLRSARTLSAIFILFISFKIMKMLSENAKQSSESERQNQTAEKTIFRRGARGEREKCSLK